MVRAFDLLNSTICRHAHSGKLCQPAIILLDNKLYMMALKTACRTVFSLFLLSLFQNYSLSVLLVLPEILTL